MQAIIVRQMEKSDAARVATLHADTIRQGFLKRLGRHFLRVLYWCIANDPDSIVWVALENGTVLGFCAFTRELNQMYRRVIRRNFFRLGWSSLPHSLNPGLIQEILDTLRYPTKQRAHSLPPAEILSIGVDPTARRKGVGRLLLDTALQHARQSGLRKIKVLAGAKLSSANRFYTACGFHKSTELSQHHETLNVYVCELGARPTPAAPL